MNTDALFHKQQFPKEQHIKSISASILNDTHIYRWFLLLTTLPEVKKKYKQPNDIYQKLFYATITSNVLHGFTIMSIGSILFLKTFYLLPTTLIPFILAWVTYRQKRAIVQIIERKIIEQDFDSFDFEHKTIYQISEHYSKMHHIPALVDLITNTDTIIRKTILFTFVFSLFIFPFFHSWQSYLLLLVNFYLACLFSNSTFVYKKIILKKA